MYSSLPDKKTVLEYLEYNAAPGTKNQQILDLAGALLFRGDAVQKKVSVLSGGERARLCLAGLLLSQYNVLVLDEPGNHLDVDTIEALAEALLAYQGTVLFTSHDRHFMKRIATNIIEVRDGKVTNYRGDYESYLYYVNKEIEDGERELARGLGTVPPAAKAKASLPPSSGRNERELRKEMANLERKIARLDTDRKAATDRLMQSNDPYEAEQLESEVHSFAAQIAAAEEEWLALHNELESLP